MFPVLQNMGYGGPMGPGGPMPPNFYQGGGRGPYPPGGPYQMVRYPYHEERCKSESCLKLCWLMYKGKRPWLCKKHALTDSFNNNYNAV